MNAWDGEKTEVTSPASTNRMNAWESNKEELPPIRNMNASIDIPSPSATPDVEKTVTSSPELVLKKPNLTRFILRIWQLFAAVGAFGFQVGASPV